MDTNSVRTSWRPIRPPIAIAGVPFDPVTLREAAARLETMLDSGGAHHVVTANVDFLVQAMRDLELHRILCAADMVVCDGAPLVWASRLLGNRLPERVAGADLARPLLELAARRRSRVFLLGGSPEAARRAAESMRASHPGLAAVDFLSPPFAPLEEMNQEEICDRIRRFRPDFLLVCFGCPKSEKWIARYGAAVQARVAVGLGAVVDFLAGRVRRAPRWMQRAGLEWSYRILQEPRRLAGRYAGDVLPISRMLFSQWRCLRPARIRAARLRPPFVSIKQAKDEGAAPGLATAVRLAGPLDAEAAARYAPLVEAENATECDCLVDLGSVEAIDSTGVGFLMSLRRRANKAGGTLTLIAPSRPVLQALRSMRVERLFEITNSAPGALNQIGVEA